MTPAHPFKIFPPLLALLGWISLCLFWPSAGWGQIITTYAGNGTFGYTGDGGPATSAQLKGPADIAMDALGNLYIADFSSNVVRKVDAVTGIITTVAGNGTAGYTGDGGPATSAEMGIITGVALDGAGNLYIADFTENVVRKVNAATGIITTLAGTGTAGYSGDGGPAASAKLNQPIAVAVDGGGNVYIADTINNVVRKVDGVTGIITTFAGTGVSSYTGDGGPASLATFGQPLDNLSLDNQGNLYVCDVGNAVIRKINLATGIITTFAGNGTFGYTGDGGLATAASFQYAGYVAFDSAGNGFVADEDNNAIREISPSGIVTTVVGTGCSGLGGYFGDGGPAISACLNHPESTLVDGKGNLYIADIANGAVRKVIGLAVGITPTPTPTKSPTPTLTPTNSPTPTPTHTPTITFTPTPTLTFTPSPTFTPACVTHVWPNPFNPRFAVSGFLNVGCLPTGASVAFYTVSGERVNQLSESGGMVQWDGKNKNDLPVSPGVYFYVIQQGSQTLGEGKFLLSR